MEIQFPDAFKRAVAARLQDFTDYPFTLFNIGPIVQTSANCYQVTLLDVPDYQADWFAIYQGQPVLI